MYINLHKNIVYRLFVIVLIVLTYNSCHKYVRPTDLNRATFKPVIGIHYTEVRRRLLSGRSFDMHGYEVTPLWKLTFLSDTQASIFSPEKQRFLKFPVTLDHDSLFNTARTWLRVKKITKDSLVFQVMKVQSNVIYLLQSTVIMTFYADDYIKNVLKVDPESLKGTDRQDTLFVKQRSAEANKYPDTVFAALQPVVLKSKSPLLKVEKEKVEESMENNFNTSDAYMYPVYNVIIHKAYQDFDYSFTARVDEHGQMQFLKNLVATMPEYEESTKKIIRGIIDGYFKMYMDIVPGNALGITHASVITVNVQGFKSEANNK